mmetsp:Transcript_30258/g.61695  ORF Transcript_30258/g.61695 Transcript_30258/m.61695 type:complete len:217 (-) Transcript_30258:163-813(-)
MVSQKVAAVRSNVYGVHVHVGRHHPFHRQGLGPGVVIVPLLRKHRQFVNSGGKSAVVAVQFPLDVPPRRLDGDAALEVEGEDPPGGIGAVYDPRYEAAAPQRPAAARSGLTLPAARVAVDPPQVEPVQLRIRVLAVVLVPSLPHFQFLRPALINVLAGFDHVRLRFVVWVVGLVECADSRVRLEHLRRHPRHVLGRVGETRRRRRTGQGREGGGRP